MKMALIKVLVHLIGKKHNPQGKAPQTDNIHHLAKHPQRMYRYLPPTYNICENITHKYLDNSCFLLHPALQLEAVILLFIPMFSLLKKLWKINRFRIAVMAAVPMMVWYFMMSPFMSVHKEMVNNFVGNLAQNMMLIWLLYSYIGTILLGIKFGPRVDVSFVGRGKKRHKLIKFNSKEYKDMYFAWIMGFLIALPFVSGLIMNGIDPKNGGLIYAPFLMYHIVCFVKDIPLSTIKLLPYLANGRGCVTTQQWSPLVINSNDIGDSSNTIYNNTYTFGGFSSNYHR